MKILAFDTSTFSGSAAVVCDGVVLSESSARMQGTHSEHLLTLIDEVLRRAGVALAHIDQIGVGIGPGSFTGVRIGVATAKGLHAASEIALYGVSSLDALAATAWGARGLIASAIDARRGEVFAALYRCESAGRVCLLQPFHGTPEAVGAALAGTCDEPVALIGDLDDALYARVNRGGSDRFSRAPSALGTPMARMVAAELAAGRGVADLGDLEPLYVRGSDAKLPAVKAR